jgi:hypothetical protein
VPIRIVHTDKIAYLIIRVAKPGRLRIAEPLNQPAISRRDVDTTEPHQRYRRPDVAVISWLGRIPYPWLPSGHPNKRWLRTARNAVLRFSVQLGQVGSEPDALVVAQDMCERRAERARLRHSAAHARERVP